MKNEDTTTHCYVLFILHFDYRKKNRVESKSNNNVMKFKWGKTTTTAENKNKELEFIWHNVEGFEHNERNVREMKSWMVKVVIDTSGLLMWTCYDKRMIVHTRYSRKEEEELHEKKVLTVPKYKIDCCPDTNDEVEMIWQIQISKGNHYFFMSIRFLENCRHASAAKRFLCSETRSSFSSWRRSFDWRHIDGSSKISGVVIQSFRCEHVS